MIRLTLILLFTYQLCLGQDIDYNKIVLPENAKGIPPAERLVQLAWKNNPSNEVFRRNVNIAKNDIKLSKRSWLEDFGVTGNVNEATFSSDSAVSGLFFPKYNIGAKLSLGFLFTKPVKTKIAKEKLAIADAEQKTQMLAIRSRVVRLYDEYMMNQKLLKIQSEILEDVKGIYTLYEEKFRNQEVPFDDYNSVLINYNKMRLDRATLENKVFNVQANIEEMIGIPLEQALSE